MSSKSPAVAYYTNKIRTSSKTELMQSLQDAPISELDLELMKCIIQGHSYKEMSQKFQKSEARIYQWKRTVFEKLHKFDMQNHAESSF